MKLQFEKKPRSCLRVNGTLYELEGMIMTKET